MQGDWRYVASLRFTDSFVLVRCAGHALSEQLRVIMIMMRLARETSMSLVESRTS